MLFRIQATHSYETCLANDPDKKKILRDALKSAERTLILLVENYLNSVATPVESIKPVVRNISTGGTASLLQH